MIIDKVVVRFKDRSLMKGKTRDFSFHKPFFTLNSLQNGSIKVSIDSIKAAFIVKSFDGNKNYTYTYTDTIPYGGTKVKVEFIDGEVMVGYNPYDVYGPYGFFMQPADLRGNNKCVFAVSSSIKELTFL